MNKPRIMFLRDERFQPVGCVAISVKRDNSYAYISYNISVLNPVDRFNRPVARQLALGRLIEKPISFLLSPDVGMNDISAAVMADIAGSHGNKMPNRAIKAAKLWLSYLSTVGDAETIH